MLVCEPRRCSSNVDRMALEHLRAAGVIFAKPKAEKKLPKGRIGWKRLNPTGWAKGHCDQCGCYESSVGHSHPYGMALCGDCLMIHYKSITAGLKPSDEVSW